MTPGAFSKAEQADLIPRLKAFLQADLDVEISDLQAGMLLDFMDRDLGHAIYNRALYDAQALEHLRGRQELAPKGSPTLPKALWRSDAKGRFRLVGAS